MAQTVGNSTLLDAWASSGDIVEPDISKIEQGWLLGEQPPHEFFNWIQNEFGQKINHVLQNGAPDWDAAKTYDPGNVVGSGGSVWIAQAINTNSTPGAANTDWVRVTTADDFENSLTSSGWQKLPGGLIIQWGRNDAGSAGPTYSFPIAFPTACLSIASGDFNAGASPNVQGFEIISASQFRFWSAVAVDDAYWIAVGH